MTRLRRFFELGAAGMWQSPGGVHVWIEPDNMDVDSCIGRAELSVRALSLKKYVQVTRRKRRKKVDVTTTSWQSSGRLAT